MVEVVQRMGKQYPKSVWRLKALVSTGNRFLYSHDADKYDPLYRAAYETFPDDSSTAYCHWKIACDAYMKRSAEAEPLHARAGVAVPRRFKAASALYFLAACLKPVATPVPRALMTSNWPAYIPELLLRRTGVPEVDRTRDQGRGRLPRR